MLNTGASLASQPRQLGEDQANKRPRVKVQGAWGWQLRLSFVFWYTPNTHTEARTHTHTLLSPYKYIQLSLWTSFLACGLFRNMFGFQIFWHFTTMSFFYFKSLVQFFHYSKNPQHGLISIVLPFLGRANLCLRMWSTVVEAPGQRHADLVWWSEVFYKYQKAQSINAQSRNSWIAVQFHYNFHVRFYFNLAGSWPVLHRAVTRDVPGLGAQVLMDMGFRFCLGLHLAVTLW